MKVIFVRHGKAAPYCEDDAGRDLTEFGRLQVQQTAQYLTKYYQLDLIITSPYNRADQTAKILLSQALNLGQNPSFMSLSSITPDENPMIAIDDLEDIVRTKFGEDLDDKCVVVVCHMPIVASMVAKLENLSPASFELAEARVLQMSVLAQGLATTQDVFIPNHS
ncbi:phosphohistidine phosphatase SixA [Moraxella catarrhalis]|uniref:phosphohistidine phosphatase SixA n=1 Tax=Moraxella catarrhalis TaxID=480 RepID=UPI000802BB37|nr:phosphohistidine phosphatase SixA [Moraxella catarrhalis]MPW63787.1 phosphohistidine phosphatase SixA [Moraxella catarrhalis]OBX44769.1 phosphohistidine phosphatase SixA [Moraxella catarrhalis]